ncbi:lipase [Marmoricola endophyticus]|uniref:Lipase n=1 Tax=Marmoricola endophyticus TaxID=2040280 RepID=A0A917BNV4_9ACTN|nr:SGNH/GDSL hydrolase family protein [Marmoricola endophyticus]GGF53223.1 lipase [Marmoricola endophyticus]
MRRLRVGAVALLALAGCGGPSPAPGEPAPSTTPPAVSSYVALGDSYTSAPYVPLTAVADGCLRSDGNYPARIADALGLSGANAVDRSCAGATTPDLTAGQRTFAGARVAPQLDAVDEDTALVTLGIGGNDFGLFGDLAGSCVFPGQAGTCGEVDATRATRVLPRIGDRVTRVVRAIQAKAPDAEVVVVGYPRIVDASTSCPAQLPLDAAARTALERVNRELDAQLAAAARRTRAAYVDMYAAGTGHDVCAGKDAWVNGVRTDTDRAAALHPFAAEQQAVAEKVLDLVHAGR